MGTGHGSQAVSFHEPALRVCQPKQPAPQSLSVVSSFLLSRTSVRGWGCCLFRSLLLDSMVSEFRKCWSFWRYGVLGFHKDLRGFGTEDLHCTHQWFWDSNDLVIAENSMLTVNACCKSVLVVNACCDCWEFCACYKSVIVVIAEHQGSEFVNIWITESPLLHVSTFASHLKVRFLHILAASTLIS
jgi:hypothetical protein